MHHYGTSDPVSIAGVTRNRKGGQWSDGRSEGGSNAGRGRHPSRGCDETLRRHDGGRRSHAVDPARELLRHVGAERLRQDHDAAHDRRVREPDGRARLPRRLRRHRRAALQARRQHRLSVLRAVPAPDGREERRVRPRAQEGLQGGDPQARRRRARARPARPTCPSASPASSPAARRSASRSPARWSTARARCCSTSRSARSTCACASSCRSSSSASSRTSGSRSCTSPTIRRRP